MKWPTGSGPRSTWTTTWRWKSISTPPHIRWLASGWTSGLRKRLSRFSSRENESHLIGVATGFTSIPPTPPICPKRIRKRMVGRLNDFRPRRKRSGHTLEAWFKISSAAAHIPNKAFEASLACYAWNRPMDRTVWKKPVSGHYGTA